MANCRLARPDDLPTLLALYRHLNPDDPELDDSAARAIWDDLLGSRIAEVILAEVNGQVAASCVLAVIPNLTRGGRPYALIENVVTDPAYRRRGLGRAILGFACDRAWARDCYKVMLMTGRQDQATLQFYEACGFDRASKTAFQQRRQGSAPSR